MFLSFVDCIDFQNLSRTIGMNFLHFVFTKFFSKYNAYNSPHFQKRHHPIHILSKTNAHQIYPGMSRIEIICWSPTLSSPRHCLTWECWGLNHQYPLSCCFLQHTVNATTMLGSAALTRATFQRSYFYTIRIKARISYNAGV